MNFLCDQKPVVINKIIDLYLLRLMKENEAFIQQIIQLYSETYNFHLFSILLAEISHYPELRQIVDDKLIPLLDSFNKTLYSTATNEDKIELSSI